MSAGPAASPAAEPYWNPRRLAFFRRLFLLALLFTLVALLVPASTVLAVKVWAASWLPWAGAMDRMDLGSQSDKLVHFSLFLLLGTLAARSWPHAAGRRWAWLGLLVLGCLTEWLQQYVPGRGASGLDLAADVAGASLGLWWVRKEAVRPVGGPA
jgi:VanZ family protein